MSDENSDVEDEFEDALEVQTLPNTMDLMTAISEGKVAIHYFFNNKFYEAQEILKPWVGRSMYHTVGNATFNFLEAVLTFERKSIERASSSLKLSIQLCNYYRKKNTFSESLGKMVKKPNYDSYTPEELHAELCFAESLLLKALLTFIEDETLVSFIRAGLKIRSCYNSYKECNTILNSRSWGDDEPHKIHFESGVRIGIGLFNLMISLLPGRVIKLLEFIGFSGSKEKGLSELYLCYNLKSGLMHVLSVLALLAYNLIIKYFVSQEEGDLEFCDKVLNNQLTLYPEGAWFLYFKGRLELIQGNIKDSVIWYIKSWKSQDVWPQFHHICFWELTWANCMLGDWKEADVYASYLLKESKWSRTIYSYQKASIMLMNNEEDLTEDDQSTITSLMSNVPKWKQRIAGKSLPMEKFAIKKAERFASQNNHLVLPAFELLYIWNYFKIISKKWELCDNVYRIIDKCYKNFEINPDQYGKQFACDNSALILLLKGSCLRHMGKPLQAEQCFKDIISMEKNIKYDTYIVPFSLFELALIYKSRGNFEKAAEILEDAKKNYSGYSLDTRLHFLVHSELTEINSQKNRYVVT